MTSVRQPGNVRDSADVGDTALCLPTPPETPSNKIELAASGDEEVETAKSYREWFDEHYALHSQFDCHQNTPKKTLRHDAAEFVPSQALATPGSPSNSSGHLNFAQQFTATQRAGKPPFNPLRNQEWLVQFYEKRARQEQKKALLNLQRLERSTEKYLESWLDESEESTSESQEPTNRYASLEEVLGMELSPKAAKTLIAERANALRDLASQPLNENTIWESNTDIYFDLFGEAEARWPGPKWYFPDNSTLPLIGEEQEDREEYEEEVEDDTVSIMITISDEGQDCEEYEQEVEHDDISIIANSYDKQDHEEAHQEEAEDDNVSIITNPWEEVLPDQDNQYWRERMNLHRSKELYQRRIAIGQCVPPNGKSLAMAEQSQEDNEAYEEKHEGKEMATPISQTSIQSATTAASSTHQDCPVPRRDSCLATSQSSPIVRLPANDARGNKTPTNQTPTEHDPSTPEAQAPTTILKRRRLDASVTSIPHSIIASTAPSQSPSQAHHVSGSRTNGLPSDNASVASPSRKGPRAGHRRRPHHAPAAPLQPLQQRSETGHMVQRRAPPSNAPTGPRADKRNPVKRRWRRKQRVVAE